MSKSNLKLEIELIPEHSWGKSLANLLPKEDWDRLRRKVYKRYNWTCQICNAYGVQVHCHESWSWNDKKRIQKLVDLKCLCGDCHNIKHWGRTINLLHEGKFTQEYINHLRRHYCEVNKCTVEDMIKHIVEAGEKNMKRSRYKYKMDLSGLKKIVKETEDCLKMRRE